MGSQSSQVRLCLTVAAGLLLAAPAAAQQFTSGNIVVLRIGDGITSLSAASSQGTLVEVNSATGAATGFTVDLPTKSSSNSGGITFSGSSASAPYLHRSTDGSMLTVIGYDAPVNSSNVATSGAGTYRRTIGEVTAAGTVTTTRMSGDTTYGGGEARSAVSDGTHFWIGGTASNGLDGLRYVSSASATTSTQLVSGNVRDVNIFNNQLFYSDSNANAIVAVGSNGPPTSGSPSTRTVLNSTNGLTSTPNGFLFLQRTASSGDSSLGNLDTAYVATAANISKFEWDGNTWTQRGSYDSTNLGNTFAVTGAVNGSSVDLYVTDQNNKLEKITDTSAFGSSISATDVWTYNAGSNYALRGVDFGPSSPTPEPTGVLAVVAGGLGLGALARRRRPAVPSAP